MSNVLALRNFETTMNRKDHLDSLAMPRASAFTRILRHPLLMPYNRLAVLMVLANVMFAMRTSELTVKLSGMMVLINFSVAIFIRQQYVINALFAMATSVPTTWPLSLRWALGKVYHFGGIHVGTFFSGFLWLSFFSYQIISQGAQGNFLVSLLIFHLLILTTMMIAALPKLRARYHNQFEMIARFGTWSSIALFWTQTFLLGGDALSFSLLGLITFSVALPWMRLRRISVEMLRPSSHVVIADFDYGVTPFAGSSTELSLNPLLEWHSFANVPVPGRSGFQLTISRAGDWTGNLIDTLPKKVWVKGIPTAGVGNIEKLFKKVVWVATGSGIGPCLPHLLSANVPANLVWATRNPRKTYGEDLVDDILAVQPKALIWDTDEHGKPDLAKLAYKACKDSGAEAVICISNKKVTWYVVHEMESLGIPAFGAIWDS